VRLKPPQKKPQEVKIREKVGGNHAASKQHSVNKEQRENRTARSSNTSAPSPPHQQQQKQNAATNGSPGAGEIEEQRQAEVKGPAKLVRSI